MEVRDRKQCNTDMETLRIRKTLKPVYDYLSDELCQSLDKYDNNIRDREGQESLKDIHKHASRLAACGILIELLSGDATEQELVEISIPLAQIAMRLSVEQKMRKRWDDETAE